MVLVQSLCPSHTAIELRHKEGRPTDDDLQQEQNIRDQPENGVRRLKVRPVVRDLVVEDDGEPGKQR